MAEDTDDGKGASQDEALDKRLAAFEERLLGKVTELLGAKGDGEGEPKKGPDEQSEPDEDEKAKGFLSRLVSRFKASGDDDGSDDQPKPEKKPGEQPTGEQKPGGGDAEGPPPWALAIASEIRELKEQQGHGLAAKRSEKLDRLYVRPEARKLVPDFNPHTEEGLAAAEKWASENEWALTVRRPRLPKIKLEDLPDPGAYGPPKEEMARVLAGVRPEDWRV